MNSRLHGLQECKKKACKNFKPEQNALRGVTGGHGAWGGETKNGNIARNSSVVFQKKMICAKRPSLRRTRMHFPQARDREEIGKD